MNIYILIPFALFQWGDRYSMIYFKENVHKYDQIVIASSAIKLSYIKKQFASNSINMYQARSKNIE